MIESIELGWNLGDNCVEIDSISPGYMDTALNRVPALDAQKKMWCSRTPMNRLGNVDELNNTAIFLASDASTFMTGSDIVVDVSFLHPATCYPVLTRHRVVTACGKMHVYHFHLSSVHTCAFGVFIFHSVLTWRLSFCCLDLRTWQVQAHDSRVCYARGTGRGRTGRDSIVT